METWRYFFAAYLIGGIPFGWLIGKLNGVDVLDTGSHSTGATNVGRSVGKLWFIVTFLLDAAKGVTVVLLASYFGQGESALALGFFTVLGHCYSPFLGGRGGKGISTLLGVAVFGLPYQTWLGALIVWIVVAVGMKKISAASLLAMCVVLGRLWLTNYSTEEAKYIGTALVALIIWQHRDNIRRLCAGQEQKLQMK